MTQNHYQILGLSKSASSQDIRSAYRLYASKFHPDKQNNDGFFEERFKEIKNAYDVLSNPELKLAYDFRLKNDDSFNLKSKDKVENNENKNKHITKKVYYTSNEFLLTNFYLNYNGNQYLLKNFDHCVIRKSSEKTFFGLGVFLIIVGIITIYFVVGIFLLALGIFCLIYREYFLILINNTGEYLLANGTKLKMKKISKMINKAIDENK